MTPTAAVRYQPKRSKLRRTLLFVPNLGYALIVAVLFGTDAS